VGITCNLSPVSAVGPGDEEAARLYDGYLNRWFAKRVGLVHVDYETQRRTLKRSGAWYRDLIARTRDARRLG
jgi:beta-glucosidase/6-phospho-beta-glucosidase/beta-galactosidase